MDQTPGEQSPKKPTIDERLEAITHTLELVAAMQLKTEKQLKRLGRYVRIITIDHERRLLALEGDDDDDEES